MINKTMTYIIVHYPGFVKTKFGHDLLWKLIKLQNRRKNNVS